MCGALAMSWPSRSKTAQEKSSRSLMLTEWLVFSSVAPICSAIDMNRLLKISSITGSTCGADRLAALSRHGARQQDVAALAERRRASRARRRWCEFASTMIAGPSMRSPGAQIGAVEERRVAPAAACPHAHGRARRQRPLAVAAGEERVLDRLGLADRLDRDRFDDLRLLRHDEAVALAVRGLEGGDDLGMAAEIDDERRVGALVAQVHAADTSASAPPRCPGDASRRGPRLRARPADVADRRSARRRASPRPPARA